MAAPALEQALGLRTYLTDTPGIGGHLRGEPEDFQVFELGDGPKPDDRGRFAAARIRLRNWETNRFVGIAANKLGVRRNGINFAGMKDKRAVTEQWFTLPCKLDRLDALSDLQDVEILEAHMTQRATHAGAHDGNRFVLRVRGHDGTEAVVDETLAQIRAAGGVPHFFGPQRFGSGVRPVTHLMGAAIVAGELEEAVRLFCGHPMPEERDEAREARTVYETTRDPEATLAVLPRQLDLERGILERLVRRPGDWRHALHALPRNLRTLFVHAHQSLVFNHVLSARIDAGLDLATAHLGDRVMAADDDGTTTHLVTPHNQARIQDEMDRGRAVVTGILPGLDVPPADGEPGAIEAKVLEEMAIEPRDFRCREMPDVASPGRRRGLLQHVADLECSWVDGDPVVSFGLGRGSYATVVMREVMKADVRAY